MPSPSWPELLSPQQRTVPSPMTAQEVEPAESALIAVVDADSPVMPETKTGTELPAALPSPNCPAKFEPQHCTVPAAITAHECALPSLTFTAVDAVEEPVIPDTRTGTELSVNVPLPNCPL